MELIFESKLVQPISISLIPFISNVSYLFIYRLDHQPQLNVFDGSPTFFCSSNDSTMQKEHLHLHDKQSNSQSSVHRLCSTRVYFCSNLDPSQSFLSVINEPMIHYRTIPVVCIDLDVFI